MLRQERWEKAKNVKMLTYFQVLGLIPVALGSFSLQSCMVYDRPTGY